MLPRPTSHSSAIGPGVAGPSLAIPSSFTLEPSSNNKVQMPLSGGKPFCVQPADASGRDPNQHTQ